MMRYRGDGVDDLVPDGPRQLVAHAGDDEEARAGDGGGGVTAALDGEERIGVAVDDERRQVQLAERGVPVAAEPDGDELPVHAAGAVAAIERARGDAADVVVVEREAGAVERARQAQRARDERL